MKIIAMVLVLFVSSCNSSIQKQKKQKFKKIEISRWDTFYLRVNENQYDVFRQSDSVFHSKFVDSEESSNFHKSYPLSISQRKLIFDIAEKYLKNPIKIESYLTCYAGDFVTIQLSNGVTSLQITYKFDFQACYQHKKTMKSSIIDRCR